MWGVGRSGRSFTACRLRLSPLVRTIVAVWDNHKGRREYVDKVKAKIDTLGAEIGGSRAGIGGIRAGISGIRAEISGVRDKLNRVEKVVQGLWVDVQNCQGMVLETGYRTMKALGGNKNR